MKMDQAKVLREKFSSKDGALKPTNEWQVRSISITSGKGGVGKTSISINLSHALAKMGKKVLLIDCDFGLANVDIMLNLQVQHVVEEVLEGSVSMKEAIIKTPYGFDVLPSSSGVTGLASLDVHSQKYFIQELSKLQGNYDFLLFDTGAGIHKTVLRINASVDEILVITNSEPTSITDAYAVIKSLRGLYKIQKFWLFPNQVDQNRALHLRKLIQQVALNNGVLIDLQLAGFMPPDRLVSQAIFQRKPWSEIQPESMALIQIQQLAKKFIESPLDKEHSTNAESEGFWKKWISFQP